MNSFPSMNDIWDVSEHNFNELALEIFRYQAKSNEVYKEYIKLIGKRSNIEHYSEIPFLPITFFKTHKILCENTVAKTIFESSSTTGKGTSKHFVSSENDYHRNCLNIFHQTFGSLSNYSIAGLLPSYLERGNSSLVSMVNFFMEQSSEKSGFYLDDFDRLDALLKANEKAGIPTLLFGVSFALLDFAEVHGSNNGALLIIETGGMKGRKKEITKGEVYQSIKKSFPKARIVSEYGMTELMSQAYSNSEGVYTSPPWMKVFGRSTSDPLSADKTRKTVALNIMDLANVHTCAFLATDDLGHTHNEHTFEILGRLDAADIRGCSLLV